jgi:hypothetical protein
MYSTLLGLHSWLRWVVVIVGVIAVVRALAGRRDGRWTAADDSIGRWFVMALDVQLLIGLILYVAVSPITQAAFANFGNAMRTPALRFWAVEHLVGMIIAIALAHVGRVKIRKAASDARRHSLAALFFGLALIVLLASIPWPGMAAARPLFRGF